MKLTRYKLFLKNKSLGKFTMHKPSYYYFFSKKEFERNLNIINNYFVFLIFKFSKKKPKKLINLLSTNHAVIKIWYFLYFNFIKCKNAKIHGIGLEQYKLLIKYTSYTLKDLKYPERYFKTTWLKKYLKIFKWGSKIMFKQGKWLSGRKQ